MITTLSLVSGVLGSLARDGGFFSLGLEVFGLLVAVFGLPGLITLSRLCDDVAWVPRRPAPVETRDDGHGPYLIDPRDLGQTTCCGCCGCVVYTPGLCGACRLGWTSGDGVAS